MRRLIAILPFLFFFMISQSTYAMLNLELTRGVSGAIPIAVTSFSTPGGMPPQDVSAIITNDLQNSGRFKVSTGSDAGADSIVLGKVESLGGNKYQVSFQLKEAFHGKTSAQDSVLLNQKFDVSVQELRPVAHHISFFNTIGICCCATRIS
jgi:TolB protein